MATAAGQWRVVRLRPGDNVAVATRPVPKGAAVSVDGVEVEAHEPIGLGHKIALETIEPGQPVRKFGQTIGFASRLIGPGMWVHVHNVSADTFSRDYAIAQERPETPRSREKRTFEGYLRPDGQVGTRNYIAVISTVNCSASTSRLVADRFRLDESWRRAYPAVDGVFAITHKSGCALPFEGHDHRVLDRVLAGFARHPNVAAYVIVGLGCESAFASHLVEAEDLVLVGPEAHRQKTRQRPTVLNIQETGGISHTVEAAVRAVHQLLPSANAWKRTEQPASKLRVALECGGSDGNSGLSANPAVGVAADLVVGQGGTAILGETPEIYGAEHLLTRRAVTPEVGQKLLDRIAWWERYCDKFGARMDNNPSPGNKAGGLTTIYEKSLGALAKGGSTALVDVVEYAERVDTPGLVFMDTPGYDPYCTTGLVSGGANVLVFTTGRGSVLGLRPTPCIKVATNTPMYERMKDDMDLDAGPILEGEPVESVGRRLFEQVLEVASGQRTKSERLGVGEEEFAPWQIGPVL